MVTASGIFISASPAALGASFEKAIWGPSELPAGNVNCPTPRSTLLGIPRLQGTWSRSRSSSRFTGTKWRRSVPSNPRDPSDPAYDWGPVDEVVSEAWRYRSGPRRPRPARAGLGEWRQSPIWAPEDPEDFADFAYVAASKRYPTIRRWMIWGEPRRAENFQPCDAARQKALVSTPCSLTRPTER